jgi:hypothetical protein
MNVYCVVNRREHTTYSIWTTRALAEAAMNNDAYPDELMIDPFVLDTHDGWSDDGTYRPSQRNGSYDSPNDRESE